MVGGEPIGEVARRAAGIARQMARKINSQVAIDVCTRDPQQKKQCVKSFDVVGADGRFASKRFDEAGMDLTRTAVILALVAGSFFIGRAT